MPRPKKGSPEAKAWGAKMRASRTNSRNKQPENIITDKQTAQAPPPDPQEHIAPEQDTREILRQLKELQENNALLKAAFLGRQDSGSNSGIGVNKTGDLIGEVDKYTVDADNYPDPTPRLAAEPKLVAALNFPFNYELAYNVGVSSYENKAGVNMREPKFSIGLHRIVIDDQGNQTDKRYVARRMVFHEDPQAALLIARENGITVDKANEKAFLDEMRYLRCRDWLFDIFWPKPAQEDEGVREEVIGNTLVQVFTKKSIDPTGVDFEKLNTKIQV